MRKQEYPPPSPKEVEIIKKCKDIGAEISRLADFTENQSNFTITKPIALLLASELEKDHEQNLLAIIMSVGAVPEFREIMLQPIMSLAKRHTKGPVTTDAINALYKILLPKDAPLVAELLCDRKIGGDRILLIEIYARLANKAAIPVLRKLVGDTETKTYALHQLSKMGDVTIEADLLRLVQHKDAWRRKIARDGLKRVEKAKSKLGQSNVH
jgi:hypothetical protein